MNYWKPNSESETFLSGLWNQVKHSADMKRVNINIDNIKVPEIHKMRSEMLGI